MPTVCGIPLPFMPNPTLMTSIIATYQVANDLRNFKKYRDITERCIEQNLERADGLKRRILRKSQFQRQMNEEVCDLPKYEICEGRIDHGRYEVIRAYEAARDQEMRTLDRGQCGLRCDIERMASRSILSGILMRQAQIKQLESELSDSYLEFCLKSLAESTAMNTYSAQSAQAFGTAGANFQNMMNNSSKNLQGSLTALGGSVGNIFNQRRNAGQSRTAQASSPLTTQSSSPITTSDTTNNNVVNNTYVNWDVNLGT